MDETPQAPDAAPPPPVPNGHAVRVHEFFSGLIAYTSLCGLLGITWYCLRNQPAYWEAVASTVPILTAIVGAYTGASYALSKAR